MMTFDEISKLRDVLERSLRAGSPAVVATLVAREGHSYRDPGSMMVMTEALELAGGVSGGCLEGYIGRAGRRLLRRRDSVLLSFDTAEESAGRPTLGCGGRLQVLVERSRPDHLALLDALLHAMETSDRGVVSWAFDANGALPNGPGCRMVRVNETVIFGGQIERRTSNSQRPTSKSRGRPNSSSGTSTFDVGRWTFDVQATALELRETLTRRTAGSAVTAAYLWPRPRLVVFGARDDVGPLVDIARTAAWHVTVIDRRDRLATPRRFPRADEVISAPWDEAIAAVRWKRWTSAVLMTHSVEDDVCLLPPLLALDLDYIGVLGPSARTDRLWDGITPAQRRRVRSPVGSPLGEKSPAAVAVSIMAELIAHRRGRRGIAGSAASPAFAGAQAP